MKNQKIVTVKLLEPELCQECRFAKMADVVNMDGIIERMIRCTRLDCDNWDYSTAKPTQAVYDDIDPDDFG